MLRLFFSATLIAATLVVVFDSEDSEDTSVAVAANDIVIVAAAMATCRDKVNNGSRRPLACFKRGRHSRGRAEHAKRNYESD
jgi:hypothetical protein